MRNLPQSLLDNNFWLLVLVKYNEIPCSFFWKNQLLSIITRESASMRLQYIGRYLIHEKLIIRYNYKVIKYRNILGNYFYFWIDSRADYRVRIQSIT